MVWLQLFLRSSRALLRTPAQLLTMTVLPLLLFGSIVFMSSDSFPDTLGLPDRPSTLRVAVNEDAVDASLSGPLGELDGVEVERARFDRDSIPEELDAGEFAAYLDAADGAVTAWIDVFRRGAVEMALLEAQSRIEVDESGIGQVRVEPVRVGPTVVEIMTGAMVPFLFVLMLVTLMLFGIADLLMKERQAGTWKLIATLPVSPVTIMLGEGGSRFVFGALQLIVFYALTALFIDINLNENVGPFILASAAGLTMCVAIGFAIGGVVPDERLGTNILLIVNIFMLFFGNMFFRFTDIPVIGVVGWANPATYLSEALRWALTGEQGAVSPLVSIFAMLGWTALALVAVRLFFRYETVTTQ